MAIDLYTVLDRSYNSHRNQLHEYQCSGANRISTAVPPQTSHLRDVEGDMPANWQDLSYDAYRAKEEHWHACYERWGMK